MSLDPWLALAAGVGLGLPAALTPGPMTALVLSQTLRHGRREGMIVAIAPVLTDGPLLLLSTLFARQLAQGAWLDGLTLVGATVCTLLAWETAHAPPPGVSDDTVPGSLRRALATNLTNPHPWVFWFTIGGPTVSRTDGWVGAAAFAGGFLGTLVLGKVVLAWLADRGASWLTGPRWPVTRLVLAAMLGVFAAGMAWTGARGLWLATGS